MSQSMGDVAPDQGRVHLALEGAVARLTFDRPAQRNAMTWRMYDDLAAAIGTINDTPAIRVAVLRGAGGKAFVAGTDIEQFRAFESGADGLAYEAKVDSYIAGLETLRVPSIAVVEGWAVGGGLAIANACDLRIATAGARFGVPIARTLGNCLSPINLRRLTETLGLSMVKRMILLAEMPTAEELVALGYLAALVPAEALDAKVAEITERLVAQAPITLRVTREMLRRLATNPQAEAPDLIAACYGSADFKAGVEAFLRKETANWRNE
jgi:enoyl-CoA hydratase/carnithine racemase